MSLLDDRSRKPRQPLPSESRSGAAGGSAIEPSSGSTVRGPQQKSLLAGGAWGLFALLTLRFLTVWGNAVFGLSLPVIGKIGFTLVFAAFSLMHAITVLGLHRALAFVGVCVTVTWSFEEAGIGTGAIYGHYHYSDQLGFKLGDVPLMIPFAWFMMIYASWIVAWFLLAGSGRAAGWSASAMRVMIAALTMTAWDAVMDPGMARAGVWTWESGGPYFGVPLQNYSGWLITTAAVYLLCEVAFRRMIGIVQPRRAGLYAGLPAIVYGLMALDRVLLPDLPELRVVAGFGMGFIGLLAVLRVAVLRTQGLPFPGF